MARFVKQRKQCIAGDELRESLTIFRRKAPVPLITGVRERSGVDSRLKLLRGIAEAARSIMLLEFVVSDGVGCAKAGSMANTKGRSSRTCWRCRDGIGALPLFSYQFVLANAATIAHLHDEQVGNGRRRIRGG